MCEAVACDDVPRFEEVASRPPTGAESMVDGAPLMPNVRSKAMARVVIRAFGLPLRAPVRDPTEHVLDLVIIGNNPNAGMIICDLLDQGATCYDPTVGVRNIQTSGCFMTVALIDRVTAHWIIETDKYESDRSRIDDVLYAALTGGAPKYAISRHAMKSAAKKK